MIQPEDNIGAYGAITDLVFDENHQEMRSGCFVTQDFHNLRSFILPKFSY